MLLLKYNGFCWDRNRFESNLFLKLEDAARLCC